MKLRDLKLQKFDPTEAKTEIEPLSEQIRSSQARSLNIVEHGRTILDQMKKDTKPLLVLVGDLTNTYLRSPGACAYESLLPLCYRDTKLVCVDISQTEKQWQDPTEALTHDHFNDFKYAVLQLGGAFMSLEKFMEVDSELTCARAQDG